MKIKKIFFLTFLMFFLLALTEDGFWNSVRVIEREVFDKNNIYSISKEDLLQLCEKKGGKVKAAFVKMSPYFDKSQKIVSNIKEIFEKSFFYDETISPFDKNEYENWKEKKKSFLSEVYQIFKKEKDLKMLEIAQTDLKMEFFREPSGKNIRCVIFPFGYSYNCGTAKGESVLFAPTLGFCYTNKECEKCLKYIRLEFFGSKEYLIGLSVIRPLSYSENYICFRFDEKGTIL